MTANQSSSGVIDRTFLTATYLIVDLSGLADGACYRHFRYNVLLFFIIGITRNDFIAGQCSGYELNLD
jgi:hypothetical protein